MKSKYLGVALSVTLLLILNESWGQSYSQSALLFGRTTRGGSARILGVGGAQVALGGDYSSALSNPAGLGMYNKSEFTFTPGVNSLTSTSRYLGNENVEVKSKLTIPGLSLVVNIPKSKDGFYGGSVGISFTRTNDFNQSFSYKGENENNSILDFFAADANGSTPANLPELPYLAYETFLIDLDGNSSNQYIAMTDKIPYQSENVQTQGASNQWSFSYGGNYKDKLFLGIGLGITSLRYKSAKIYSEEFADGDLTDFELNENLTVKGNAINLTLGVIGRPMDFIQVGASYTSPSFNQLDERYDASISSNWINPTENYYKESDIITSSYSLTTPSKLSAGVAFISKFGFITGDVELTNAGGARYASSTDGLSFSTDNSDIKSNYKSGINYRVGAEFKYSFFRARAGYGVQSNTFSSKYKAQFTDVSADNKISSVSGGVGVRGKKVFADFALVVSKGDNIYSPYPGSPTVKLSNELTRGIVTVGFTF